MVNIFTVAVVAFLCVTEYVSAAHTSGEPHHPFNRHVLSKVLEPSVKHGRDDGFEWEPDAGKCLSECAGLLYATSTCKDSACYCTDVVASSYRQCMVCSIDLQNNSYLQSDAQQSMVDYEVNCESDGFPVASLSIAVAAPTAQPPPVSPAWSTSWTIPATQTIMLPGAVHTEPPSNPGVTPVITWWTSSDSFGASAGWSTVYGASFTAGPVSSPDGYSGVNPEPAATGSTLSVPPDSSSLSTDQALVPTTPVSGTTIVTFNSLAATPSASDIPEDNRAKNGVEGTTQSVFSAVSAIILGVLVVLSDIW